METIIHPIQIGILKKLLFNTSHSFTALKARNVTTDKLSFHLNRLKELELIIKKGNEYSLTNKGKKYANKFNTESNKIDEQAKLSILVCCTRKKDGKIQYLMQQRLKQPYFGFWGFISGKIIAGELVSDTAARELKEETGLSANIKFVGIKHKIDLDHNGNLLEDKFFYTFCADTTKGQLFEKFDSGINKWVFKKDIELLGNLFGDVMPTLKLLNKKYNFFVEEKYTVDGY